MDFLLVLALFVLACGQVVAHGNGAPEKSCNELYPKHDVVQMATPSPYVIEVDVTSYSPGQRVKVMVRSPVNTTFRGVVLAARRTSGDTEEVIGTFENIPDDLRPLSWYADPPNSTNCVCHKDSTDKREALLTWIAPNTSAGDVIFRATLVKNYESFWYNIKSKVIKATQPAVDHSADYQIAAFLSEMSLDECGVSKGCFLYPDGCESLKKCKYGATYWPSQDKQRVHFEMFGDAAGYISLSTSADRLMGDEWTVSCMEEEGRTSVQNGHNPALHNELHRRVNLRDIQLTRLDGKILCTFSKLVKETYIVNDRKKGRVLLEYDLTGNQYIFLAWGDLFPGTTIMQRHVELPLVSTTQVNLFEAKISYGRTLHIYLQLHGTLALIAWMTLGGIAVIVSRHFRVVLKNVVLGTATWLQIHRVAMYLSTAVCVVAVILIFVYLKIWTKYATAHAVTGLVAMGLALFTALSGFLRPDPKHRNRALFAWFHRIGGMAGFYIAAASLYLGYQVDLLETSLKQVQQYIILGWLGFHLLCDLLLDKLPFKALGCSTPGAKEVDVNGTVVEETRREGCTLHPKLILLVIYIGGNFAFTITSLFYLLSS